MKTAIENARIVMSDCVIEGGTLCFENGVITSVGAVSITADQRMDAGGKYLVPGFVDLHCHGCLGYAFNDADVEKTERIANFHLSHGTTSMLASTSTAYFPQLEEALSVLSSHIETAEKTPIVGIFMEGPWLSTASAGAQSASMMRAPAVEDVRYLKEKYPHILRLGVAPEEAGGMEMGREGSARGILMSAAHTAATFSDIELAFENGYKLLTHFYCAMKGVERKNAYRVAGAVEAGFYLDDMFVEIIADGKHLPEELLRLIYKIKGVDRICLVTDATRAAGLADGSITKTIGGLSEVLVEDGVAKMPDRSCFAGSTATADRLYRTMADAVGRDMVALSRMASLTPARLMGWTDRGEIAVGKRADLVLLDENLYPQTVFLNGKTI